jgi:hypothetical protein
MLLSWLFHRFGSHPAPIHIFFVIRSPHSLCNGWKSKENNMKTTLNLKTTLYMILLVAGCAGAQERAESNADLTVTDINDRVLMTNASYACAYQGRLFFNRGCHVEGFAATNINPAILSRLGLNLEEIEAKGREDLRKKQASDRAYERYAQYSIAQKALENERAARRAEADRAAREAAREEISKLNAMNGCKTPYG